MTRVGSGRLLGAVTFLAGVLLMLAGSDLPPPVGFAWVMLIAAAIGIAVAYLVPIGLRLRDRVGTRRALLRATGVGGAVGIGVAALLVLNGSGEPSVPQPGPPESIVFLAVVGIVGAIAATAVLWLAIVADGATTRRTALALVLTPAALMVLGLATVIAARVAA